MSGDASEAKLIPLLLDALLDEVTTCLFYPCRWVAIRI